MICALVSSISVPATGLKARKIRPLDGSTGRASGGCTKRPGFDSGPSQRFHESRNLASNNSKRCRQIVSSSSSKYSVPPTFDSVEDFTPEKEMSIAKKLGAIYAFARPYPIYGTIVEVIFISLFPVGAMSDLSPAFFLQLFKTIIPLVLVFVYANGLNEITDIEIDKINKPFLPLPSGDLSLTEAVSITSISAVVSFLFAAVINSLPLSFAIMSIFFGLSAYSIELPLLRWKKNAVLTAATLSIIRGVVLPLCFFAHAQTHILGKPFMCTKQIFFTMAVMTPFAVVIAVFKDIPDVEGDKLHGVRSASVLYGVEKVFWSCVYLLMATYGGAAIFGATSAHLPAKIIVSLGHVILAIVLWTRAKSTNVSDSTATLAFYLFMWKFIYAEYLIIQFVH